jgi:Mn-dependent DtxR family transcriptional regulator
MVSNWMEMALVKVHNNTNLHRIEKLELLDAGLVHFTETENLVLTQEGKKILERVLSPDHASKRY